jgi:hypothetical protein
MSTVFWRRLERLENPAGHELSNLAERIEQVRRRRIDRLCNPEPVADAREAEEEDRSFRAMEAQEAAGDLSELEMLMLAGKRRVRVGRETRA